MIRSSILRSATLGVALAAGLLAQSNAPEQPARSTPPNAPYHGQTGLPNNAAANDQPNTALSGNTPETNSSLQQTRNGNQGIEIGWLGALGLLGLLGFARSRNTELHTPEMHRG
jgi:hypothetical protein